MSLGSGIPADRPRALAVKTPCDAKPALKVSTNPTPPLTPVLTDDGSPTSFLGSPGSSSGRNSVLLGPSSGLTSLREPIRSNDPREFEWDLEIQRDSRGNPIELGRGAWSIVYRAVCHEIEPVSPADSEPMDSQALSGRVFAVKTPLRRDAHRILKAEASLLTRLSRIAGHENHLVPFQGYISQSHAMVMMEVPLTLSSHIKEQAAIAQEIFSTKTMFDPILGMSKWLEFSGRLVKGLAWLHDQAQVVHGDVKPQNILLRLRDPKYQEDTFPFDPLYMDFTSSDDLSSSETCPKDGHGFALSALTPPFAAPELLTIAALKSPNLAPSKASDVFSLAVTLLTAVTGDLQLYPGAGSMQCLAMSRDGHRVLDFVRSGANCSRVPRKGPVESVLAPAVVKDPDSRVQPAEWLDLIRAEIDGLSSA